MNICVSKAQSNVEVSSPKSKSLSEFIPLVTIHDNEQCLVTSSSHATQSYQFKNHFPAKHCSAITLPILRQS